MTSASTSITTQACGTPSTYAQPLVTVELSAVPVCHVPYNTAVC